MCTRRSTTNEPRPLLAVCALGAPATLAQNEYLSEGGPQVNPPRCRRGNRRGLHHRLVHDRCQHEPESGTKQRAGELRTGRTAAGGWVPFCDGEPSRTAAAACCPRLPRKRPRNCRRERERAATVALRDVARPPVLQGRWVANPVGGRSGWRPHCACPLWRKRVGRVGRA